MLALAKQWRCWQTFNQPAHSSSSLCFSEDCNASFEVHTATCRMEYVERDPGNKYYIILDVKNTTEKRAVLSYFLSTFFFEDLAPTHM